MEKGQLEKLYKLSVKKTGFREDKENLGWTIKQGPNDYRAIVKHGFYKDKYSVISVVEEKIDIFPLVETFKKYQKTTQNKKGILLVPEFLTYRKIPGGSYFIQAEVKGKRILENFPFTTQDEKNAIANLYWDTIKAFPKLDFSEWTAADHFLERVDQWFTTARINSAVKKGFITREEKTKATEKIFSNISQFKMQPFFRHFFKTDIVKAGDRYFIWEAPIAPRPAGDGPALWLWAGSLYAFDLPPQQWIREINLWIKTFVNLAPLKFKKNLDEKIRICFLERVLGSLMLDLPNKKSPFDNIKSNTTFEKAIKLNREILKMLLK